MTKLTNSEKIIRWSSLRGRRLISHAKAETGQTEKNFLRLCNKLQRKGLIKCEKIGRYVILGMTQVTYQNRSVLVK